MEYAQTSISAFTSVENLSTSSTNNEEGKVNQMKAADQGKVVEVVSDISWCEDDVSEGVNCVAKSWFKKRRQN